MPELIPGEQVDRATHQRNGIAVPVPSADLTTHAVIVGMTGSGKTGLGVVLIEEALSAGVPCLLIDPKGDLGNLLLLFPELRPEDFRPWIDERAAGEAGRTPEEEAAHQASAWRDGLASWGVGPDRIAALHERCRFSIYTPGSTAGIPVNLVGSLDAPPAGTDPETVQDEIDGFVAALLGMVGIDADPLSSREHILLTNLIAASWGEGRSLDLATLVGQVQQPPLRKLGVFEVDAFFPPADRTKLAMRLNGLLASPSFAAWGQGVPLDLDRLLWDEAGRPSCAVITTAHLSDEERQFVVTLILGRLVTWMRREPGTSDLRAMLYVDEVAGYVPPNGAPPTKKPILLLMKQARAFGVGVVLATQNPVDVDYKAISNAGTWMIGRLQTEQDKARLLAGLTAASGTVDVRQVSDEISALGRREFVLKRAGKDAPERFTTRWAMSYLRGPLTRDQIAGLMADQKAQTEPPPATAATLPPPAGAPASGSALPPPPTGAAAPVPPPPPAAGPPSPQPPPAAAPALTPVDATPVMPEIAASVPVRWVATSAPWLAAIGGRAAGTQWSPAAIARVRLRFDEEKAGFVVDQEWEAVLHPLGDRPDASLAVAVDHDERDLLAAVPKPLPYALVGGALATKTYWTSLQRSLVDRLVADQQVVIHRNVALKLWSRTGESRDAFLARCDTEAQARADAEAAKLRDKYATKSKSLQTKLQTAEGQAQQAATTAQQRQAEEVSSGIGDVLGAFLGGRSSARQISRSVSSASSRRGRAATAAQRAEAAADSVADLRQQLVDLDADLAAELADIDAAWEQKGAEVEDVPVRLEKADVSVDDLVLGWVPVA